MDCDRCEKPMDGPQHQDPEYPGDWLCRDCAIAAYESLIEELESRLQECRETLEKI